MTVHENTSWGDNHPRSGTRDLRVTGDDPFPIRALAPAKINLGLLIGPTRPDGRHELVSVMQSISLADELTLERTPRGAGRGGGGGSDLSAAHESPPTSDPDQVVCPGASHLEQDNLAGAALAAFRQATGWNPGPLTLTILKRVPVAAGLGGGSGDAAAALRLVALASGLDEPARLHELARELGADVPAQVTPGRWLALGAGEQLSELPPAREPFGVLVLPASHGLSTADVYAEADRLGGARTRAELQQRALELSEVLAQGDQLPPGELLANDLQRAAVSLCPQIEDSLAQARASGADVTLVSGSGPTVLGLFAGPDGPRRAGRAASALVGRVPAAVAAVPVEGTFAKAQSAHVRNNESS